jgi:hypothetical protein
MKEKVPFVNFAINTSAFPNIYTRFVAPAAGLALQRMQNSSKLYKKTF